MSGEGKNESFQNLMLRMRELIARQPEGGRFPSSREMSAKLGVCLATYGKALEHLYEEGTLYKDGSKGTCIRPLAQRTRKVGLVVSDGRESPFLFMPKMLAGVLSKLQDASIYVQIVQAPVLKDVVKKAKVLGADALLWLNPSPAALPVLESLKADGSAPFLIIENRHSSVPFSLKLQEFPTLTVDCEFSGEKRAELICRKERRKVVYIGKSNEFCLQLLKFDQALAKRGAALFIKKQLDTPRRIEAGLRAAIAESGADLIYAEGGPAVISVLLPLLEKIEKKRRPAVFATSFHGLEELAKLHPEVEIAGTWDEDYTEPYSGLAVEKLKALFERGEPLSSERIKLPFTAR